MARGGFTTVRDLGSGPESGIATRDAIREGESIATPLGPALLAAFVARCRISA